MEKTKTMTIVLCSKGYPGKYKNNIKLNNLNSLKLSKKDYIFHAGTKLLNNEVVSNGGRVLNITSTGDNFLELEKNYNYSQKIKLEKRFL